MCGGTKTVERVLLPKNVRPNGCELDLIPDMKSCRYTGTVSTELLVVSASDKNSITFHNVESTIDFSRVTLRRGGQIFSPSENTNNATDETVTITFPGSPFVAGEVIKLVVPFENLLNDEMAGFYRSKYKVGNDDRWIATTQFEPVDARRAFPCWDEPALKTTFKISLTVPSDLIALSNMPVEREEKMGDLKTVHFQITPKMSTYLLAWVIGEFDYVEGLTKNGVPMRVYTPLGQSSKGKFALDFGIKVLDYFEEFFGIPYPLPKLDHVAIPDFSSGAMENWGLITYRDLALLCDVDSNVIAKNRVAYVVAHEEAHQWFGNICTPEWWRELWLNEGFATWAGNLGVDHVFPEWDVWTQFRSTCQATSFSLDALLSSHPVELDVANSRNVSSIFDAISYHKGASVILMLAEFLGLELFAKGVHLFLSRFSYDNAVSADLWKALSDVSGFDITSMMDNWISAVGFPVLSVKTIENGQKLEISQSRFLAGSIATNEQDTTIWDIQLAIQTSESSRSYLALKQKSQVFDYDVSSVEWFKANAGQSGVLRVHYDSSLFEKIKKAVKNKSFNSSDRIGVLGDYFAMCKAGLVSIADLLDLLTVYDDEDEYAVWQEVSITLASLTNILENTEASDKFRQFCIKIWSKIACKLGWAAKPGDNDLTLLLRTLVLTSMAVMGDDAVIAEARRKFDAYRQNPSTLSSNLRDLVFRCVVTNGTVDDHAAMKTIFREAGSPELKVASLFAVGSTRNPSLIGETLEWGFNSGEVRSQDIQTLLSSCSQTGLGKIATFEAVKKNWATIVERYSSAGFLSRSIVECSCGGFVTFDKADEVEKFYSTHTMKTVERTIQQCLERIRCNAAWRTRELEAATSWLVTNV